MTAITLQRLRAAVEYDSAIRRVQRLVPVDGPGGKVFPPTYPGSGRDRRAQHIYETRRIDGQDVRCVLLDSVQSQANRLEEALLRALREQRLGEPHVGLPHLVVDFRGQSHNGTDVSDVGEITSLDAPHRVFDAIIRDSQSGSVVFAETPMYKELLLAKPTNALPVFRLSPTSLVFGAWNSTGEGGGLGAKFARCLVSEIVGVGAIEGQRSAVRVDPLGIRSSAAVSGGPLDWTPTAGVRGQKSKRPSEIGHSNIISSIESLGTSIDHAVHSAVISCAGLRRSRFPGIADEAAGRAALAALALFAVIEQDRAGYALRSRCDLVPTSRSTFELVQTDGEIEPIEVDAQGAARLLSEAVAAAKRAGFPWGDQPVRLVPQKKLIEQVVVSRSKALAGELEDAGDEDA